MSDEPGEARDSAEPEETALDHAEGSEDAETDFHPFDEVDEDFQPGPAVRIMGPDGLPQTVDQTTESDIPALSTESLVCMGDFSKFVLRDRWGDLILVLDADKVQRTPNGRWRARGADVVEASRLWVARMRKQIDDLRSQVPAAVLNEHSDPLAFVVAATTPVGQLTAFDLEWVEVEPIRPQCVHYVRQQGSFHLNAQAKKHYRLCSARRTTEGTFMTVSDLGMWACDMRDPYDVASVKHLDDFDALKIRQGKERTHLPMFHGFGIFDTPKRDDKKEN